MSDDRQISIAGLDKIEVLRALYAKPPLGDGAFCEPELSVNRAKAYLRDHLTLGCPIDYIDGHSIHVDLRGDTFDATEYDRDNGQGEAMTRIRALRELLGGSWNQAPLEPEAPPARKWWRP